MMRRQFRWAKSSLLLVLCTAAVAISFSGFLVLMGLFGTFIVLVIFLTKLSPA